MDSHVIHTSNSHGTGTESSARTDESWVKGVPDWLSPTADILSILGFVFTIWVLWTTNSLRRTFLLRARTPALRKDLQKLATELPDLIPGWPRETKKELLSCLAKGSAKLASLESKLSSRTDRREVRDLAQLMRGATGALSSDQLWNIHSSLQRIISKLDERAKDAPWSQ